MSSPDDSTMAAQVIDEFGGPEVFEHAELDRPEPAADEVLIDVEATSVNPVDYKIRRGDLPDFAHQFPAVLGCDAAGVVESVGADVTRFEPGEEVYAMAGGVAGSQGALAEYMTANVTTVAHAPESLSLAEAATLPVVALTAHEMLADRADVGDGDSVLVYGGAGGVGHIGVQIAAALGADVYATGSTERKRELAAELGAKETIDYTTTDPEEYVAEYTDGTGFDVVFDPIGNTHLETAFEAVRPYGRVVTTEASDAGDLDIGPMHERALSMDVVLVIRPILFGEDTDRIAAGLETVADLVDEGDLKPVLDEDSFEFEAIGEAHRHAESGDHVGKVSVTR